MTQDNNAKHYERLEIEPWDIMKADFTKEEWIGFLKGNIIKYVLREKGENEKDAQKIQKYAKELEEAYRQQNEVLSDICEDTVKEHKRPTIKSKFNLAENITKLTSNKWYDANLFAKEDLEVLLPIGTLVEVRVDDVADIHNTAPTPTEETKVGRVEFIQRRATTHIFIEGDKTLYFWFKVIG